LAFVVRGNFPLIMLSITFLRFAILSTSYVIPQYITTVQNYRAIQIGGVLLWIALPQFVLAPTIATILRFIDARWLIALGFALIGFACFMASRLTQDCVGDNFLLSQLVQAVGQSLALTALVWFALKHLDPAQVLTFGAALQIATTVRSRTRYSLRANVRAGTRAALL